MAAIDDYLAKSATPEQRAVLEHIRQLTKDLVPEAEETISYGVPTLKYKGTYLIYFAAFKDHMSVFPGGELLDTIKAQLEGYKVAKGTIQFTVDKQLPDKIIKELVLSRKALIEKKKNT